MINMGLRKLKIQIFLAVILLCSVFILPSQASEFNPEPVFSSFEHKNSPDFSIENNQMITSIDELFPFIKETIFFEYEKKNNVDGKKLLKNIISGNYSGDREIIISVSKDSFSVSDSINNVKITDTSLVSQMNKFNRLLNTHLKTENNTSDIISSRIVLKGEIFSNIEFSFADGGKNKFSNEDPGFPFSKISYSEKSDLRDKNMLGYLVGSTTGSSYSTVINHGDKMNFISPAWFWLDLDKPGIFKKDPNFGTFSDEQVKEIVDKSHGMGIKVLALFHNLTNNPVPSKDMLHRILSEPELRQKCIDDIVAKIKKYNFDGVNMDFEFIHLKDRDGYSEFMKHLQIRLKSIGKMTTIAVPAKFSDTVNSWNGQFDYEKLGIYSDIVMVMTYNENGKWTKPGPVASLPWVEKAMKYSVSKIPAHKVMMGFPTYGYDWTENGGCKSLSCKKAASILKTHNATMKWHSYYASPYFEYRDSDNKKHTVWYENKESLEMKFKLINKYNLNGAGMWRLGMETEDFWSLIK